MTIDDALAKVIGIVEIDLHKPVPLLTKRQIRKVLEEVRDEKPL